MKKKIVFILSISVFVVLLTTFFYSKGEVSNKFEIEKIDSIPNFFKSQDFYFAGQPDAKTLETLKNEGVNLVINLRSEGENKKHTEENFNEEELVAELEMDYVSIPMSGIDAYCPETLEKVAEAIKSHKGKTLIHCAGCGRVTHVWMAYLIKHCNYTVDEAVAVGKQLRFRLYLEYLLDEEVTMDIKK